MNTIKVKNFGKIMEEMIGLHEEKTWRMIFPRFMLQIDDLGFVYYVEEGRDEKIFFSLHVRMSKEPDKYVTVGKFMIDNASREIVDINVSDDMKGWLHKKTDVFGITTEIQNFTDYILFATLEYITLKSKEREKSQKGKSSHRQKYSREHRLSTTNNKIYLLDDIITYASEKYISESGHLEFTCPCWEVRGHYRHYKNGNVVFIKSYKKGKDKDKAEPKSHEYMLERGKDEHKSII